MNSEDSLINKLSFGRRLELVQVKFASVSGFAAMKCWEAELTGALLKSYNADLLRNSN